MEQIQTRIKSIRTEADIERAWAAVQLDEQIEDPIYTQTSEDKRKIYCSNEEIVTKIAWSNTRALRPNGASSRGYAPV